MKHCEEKLDKLGDNDTKRHQNYLQVIGSLLKEGNQGKIGDLTEKFQSLDELKNFIEEKFKDKKEFIPNIDQKYSKNTVIISL